MDPQEPPQQPRAPHRPTVFATSGFSTPVKPAAQHPTTGGATTATAVATVTSSWGPVAAPSPPRPLVLTVSQSSSFSDAAAAAIVDAAPMSPTSAAHAAVHAAAALTPQRAPFSAASPLEFPALLTAHLSTTLRFFPISSAAAPQSQFNPFGQQQQQQTDPHETAKHLAFSLVSSAAGSDVVVPITSDVATRRATALLLAAHRAIGCPIAVLPFPQICPDTAVTISLQSSTQSNSTSSASASASAAAAAAGGATGWSPSGGGAGVIRALLQSSLLHRKKAVIVGELSVITDAVAALCSLDTDVQRAVCVAPTPSHALDHPALAAAAAAAAATATGHGSSAPAAVAAATAAVAATQRRKEDAVFGNVYSLPGGLASKSSSALASPVATALRAVASPRVAAAVRGPRGDFTQGSDNSPADGDGDGDASASDATHKSPRDGNTLALPDSRGDNANSSSSSSRGGATESGVLVRVVSTVTLPRVDNATVLEFAVIETFDTLAGTATLSLSNSCAAPTATVASAGGALISSPNTVITNKSNNSAHSHYHSADDADSEPTALLAAAAALRGDRWLGVMSSLPTDPARRSFTVLLSRSFAADHATHAHVTCFLVPGQLKRVAAPAPALARAAAAAAAAAAEAAKAAEAARAHGGPGILAAEAAAAAAAAAAATAAAAAAAPVFLKASRARLDSLCARLAKRMDTARPCGRRVAVFAPTVEGTATASYLRRPNAGSSANGIAASYGDSAVTAAGFAGLMRTQALELASPAVVAAALAGMTVGSQVLLFASQEECGAVAGALCYARPGQIDEVRLKRKQKQ